MVRALVAIVALGGGLGMVPAPAANVVAIGDSLTAEYDTLPDVSGFPTEATAYAEVTVDGWESKSWVEIVAQLRPSDFNFGRYRTLSDPWTPPRLSGYATNWGVPGVDASLYEDFVTSSVSNNPLYFTLRQPLENQLENLADRVVIWLGTNDFRANYGAIYDGGSADALINGLLDDLEHVVDFVRAQNPDLQIVIVNIPDIGATPSRKVAHPDPAKRAIVSAAIATANDRIEQLAAEKGIALADVSAITSKLINGTPVYFGAVQMIDDENADNDPHYLFTRDGLHPNTGLQVLIARSIIRAFDTAYGAGIRQITDAEALAILHINPREPYVQWIESFNVSAKGPLKDPDADGMSNLVECAFNLNPSVSDAASLPASRGGPVAGVTGEVSVTYTPDASRDLLTDVLVQYSVNGTNWKKVPSDHLIDNGDGSFTAVVPPQSSATVFTRLKVSLVPPAGANVTIASVVPVQ
jgi:lysophospholipase L1-like esterase